MTILYIVLLSVGVVYALVVLVTGGLHLHLPAIDFNHDGIIDFGGDTPGPRALSPIAIASFVTAFGGFGLVGQWLFPDIPFLSLLTAVVGGFVIAAIANLAFTFLLIKPQGSSEVRTHDVIGSEAEVMTPIPKDSVGEIALVAQGGRLTFPAKSSSGEAINRNTTVVIEKVVGGIAFVRPQ